MKEKIRKVCESFDILTLKLPSTVTEFKNKISNLEIKIVDLKKTLSLTQIKIKNLLEEYA